VATDHVMIQPVATDHVMIQSSTTDPLGPSHQIG